MIEAIILAGGKTNESLQQISTAGDEALISIGNKKMIEYVLAALTNTKQIKGIIVVGPKELQAYLPPNAVLKPPGENILENLKIGIASLSTRTSKALIATSDIPFLTAKAIDNFIAASEEQDADFCYPVIPREVCEKRFPEVSRTYVKIKDGVFTGGNIFLLNPKIIPTHDNEIQELIANRKHPIKMLKVLGFSFILKFLLKQLTIKDLETKVSNLFKFKGVAIISQDAEIGVDVDKANDLELARNHLVN